MSRAYGGKIDFRLFWETIRGEYRSIDISARDNSWRIVYRECRKYRRVSRNLILTIRRLLKYRIVKENKIEGETYIYFEELMK